MLLALFSSILLLHCSHPFALICLKSKSFPAIFAVASFVAASFHSLGAFLPQIDTNSCIYMDPNEATQAFYGFLWYINIYAPANQDNDSVWI